MHTFYYLFFYYLLLSSIIYYVFFLAFINQNSLKTALWKTTHIVNNAIFFCCCFCISLQMVLNNFNKFSYLIAFLTIRYSINNSFSLFFTLYKIVSVLDLAQCRFLEEDKIQSKIVLRSSSNYKQIRNSQRKLKLLVIWNQNGQKKF